MTKDGLIIPEKYQASLDTKETEIAIKLIKDNFENTDE